MNKRVTMEQIAEAANVSKGLVSRALTDRYGVSNEMRSFIKMKATELGYDFNKIKTKQVRKKKCCLLISSRVLTRESYWQPIIRRMEEELSFVGIETHYFVHGEKQFSEDEQKKFRFATLSFEVELEPDAPTDLELEVSWPFNGRYAGQQVGTLKAAGLIALPGPASTGSTGADTSGEDVPKDADVPQDADVPGGQRRVLSVWRKERDA